MGFHNVVRNDRFHRVVMFVFAFTLMSSILYSVSVLHPVFLQIPYFLEFLRFLHESSPVIITVCLVVLLYGFIYRYKKYFWFIVVLIFLLALLLRYAIGWLF